MRKLAALFFALALPASAMAQPAPETNPTIRLPTWAYLIASAWTDSEEQTERAQRDGVQCVQHATRSVSFSSAQDVVTVARVAVRSCERTGPAQLAIILSTPSTETGLGFEERIVLNQDSDDAVVLLSLHGAYSGNTQRTLERMIDADPIAASATPTWRADALQPDLPERWRWLRGVDRATYMSIRESAAPLWCARSSALRFTCWTPAPQHTSALEVMTLEGPRGVGATASACEFVRIAFGAERPCQPY